jgi:hypothetical protein
LKFSAEITNKAYTPENSAQKYIPGQFGYLLMGKLHVDFGNRLQYFHARDSIMVYNDGYRVIIIKEVVGLPEYLHVPQLPLTIEPKQGLQLYIDVKSETLDTVGPVSGSFRFITTDQFFPEKTVTFYMNLAIDFDSWKRRDLKKAAVFTTESTTVDMGQMKGGAVKTKTIEISNTGKSPLIIYRVESDCSCTLLEEAVRVIQPGEVVTLVIKFDSLYKHGKQSKAVKVYTNDPNMPIVIFTVSAVVN